LQRPLSARTAPFLAQFKAAVLVVDGVTGPHHDRRGTDAAFLRDPLSEALALLPEGQSTHESLRARRSFALASGSSALTMKKMARWRRAPILRCDAQKSFRPCRLARRNLPRGALVVV
jgi:hypothetical protein